MLLLGGMTHTSKTETGPVIVVLVALSLTACGAQSVDIGDADADGPGRSDADQSADADEHQDADEEAGLPVCDDSINVSPYCDVEGYRCLRDDGCCECVDTHGCGLQWDCLRIDPEPACPDELPVDGEECPENRLYCNYCMNGSPRRFYCGNSGVWDFRALEVDCP